MGTSKTSYNQIFFLIILQKILNMKMLMAPILTFLILINNQGKSEARMASLMGTLKTIKNGVSGDIHSTDNEMVLEIKNFKYDGKGPDVYFYVGKKGTEIKNANIDGIRLPYPENSDQKLGKFNGETIRINLPKEIKFGVDFGHLIFDYGSTNVNIDDNKQNEIESDDHYGRTNVNIDENHNGVEIIVGSHLLMAFMLYFCKILI